MVTDHAQFIYTFLHGELCMKQTRFNFHDEHDTYWLDVFISLVIIGGFLYLLTTITP